MNSKELVQQGYDLFAKGDMEGFMNLVHDDFTFVYPGDKHPFSGTHNKEGFQQQLMKVPELWSNFHLTVESPVGRRLRIGDDGHHPSHAASATKRRASRGRRSGSS